MIEAFDIYGIYVPSLLVFALIAAAVTALAKRLMAMAGIYRFVWHRSLFDLALFVVILGLVFFLFEGADRGALPVLSQF